MAEQNSAVALKYVDEATVLENGIIVLASPAAELRQREDVRAFYFGQKPQPAAEAAPIPAVA